jgi:hypothetical protein
LPAGGNRRAAAPPPGISRHAVTENPGIPQEPVKQAAASGAMLGQCNDLRGGHAMHPGSVDYLLAAHGAWPLPPDDPAFGHGGGGRGPRHVRAGSLRDAGPDMPPDGPGPADATPPVPAGAAHRARIAVAAAVALLLAVAAVHGAA